MKRFGIAVGSAMWSTANASARWMSDHGWRTSVALDTRVISVGNLQAGGSGKTPLVARIAEEAARRGQACAILCRGYGGRWESGGGVIRPAGPRPDPSQCGDEAALLHSSVPTAWVGVGADRVRQYGKIAREIGRAPDLVVLDDGFQHHRIRSDVHVLAVTSTTRGERLYRDFDGAAAKADLLVWTKGTEDPAPRFPDATAPWVRVRFRIPPAPSAPVLELVTGVGDPQSVETSLREAGYRVERHHRFPDHHAYSREEVRDLLAQVRARGSRVALTRKDWVKWSALGVAEDEVCVFEPVVEVVAGQAAWDRVLWKS